MRIIITGGSGFVGKALIRELIQRKVDPVAVARHSFDSSFPQMIVKNYDHTPAGDVLVHLAETRDISIAEDQGVTYIEQNMKLLQQLIKKDFKRVVYASSAIVYGDGVAYPRRTTESLTPVDTYARAKVACEGLVAEADGVVARLANLYGEGMATNNVISHILAQIPGQGAIKIFDDTPVRDFLWIEDAARGLADMALGAANGIFNLGTGIGTSIGELGRCCLQIAGQSDREIVASRPSKKSSCIILDTSNTISAFGWSPKISLFAGLTRLMKG